MCSTLYLALVTTLHPYLKEERRKREEEGEGGVARCAR